MLPTREHARRARFALAAIAVASFQLLALASCGGKEGGTTTGLDSSILLGDLTEEEASAGCARLDALVERRFDQQALAYEQCTLYALQLATEEARCIAQRNGCVQARAENRAPAAPSFFAPTRDVGCGNTSVSWRGCTATVGALEACLHDVLDGLEAAIETYTCEDAPTYRHSCLPPINPYVSMDEVDPATGRPYQCELLPVPASCRALQGECPSLSSNGLP